MLRPRGGVRARAALRRSLSDLLGSPQMKRPPCRRPFSLLCGFLFAGWLRCGGGGAGFGGSLRQTRLLARGFIRMDDAFLRGLVELRLDRFADLGVLCGDGFLVDCLQTRFDVQVALRTLVGLPHPLDGGLDVRHESSLLALKARGTLYHAPCALTTTLRQAQGDKMRR